MKDDRLMIEWESPDWTPDEVGSTKPPFTLNSQRSTLQAGSRGVTPSAARPSRSTLPGSGTYHEFSRAEARLILCGLVGLIGAAVFVATALAFAGGGA